MEQLSRLIDIEVNQKEWTPFSIRGFSISHVFYADDVVLFGRASIENVNKMLGVLSEFGRASRLSINQLSFVRN